MSPSAAGFFRVLLPDGTTAYTRDGAFQIDQNGQLVTASGYPIQPAITLPQDAGSLTVGSDGPVSVTLAGQTAPQQVGQLTLTTFINDSGPKASVRTSTAKPSLPARRMNPRRG